MKFLDLKLDDPAKNIALDEALLAEADEANEPREVLRVWESPAPVVVVGRSSQVELEVSRTACDDLGISIFRRTTGGASIVAGPGCFMYAVVLSCQLRPKLQAISEAHCFVLNTILRAMCDIVPQAKINGTSDLTLEGRKFSGNSMRCGRTHILYHGTILYDFDLALVGQCLGTPPRQPDYREGREHNEFVTNVPMKIDQFRASVVDVWQADEVLEDWPEDRVAQLVAEKYSRDDWNYRR